MQSQITKSGLSGLDKVVRRKTDLSMSIRSALLSSKCLKEVDVKNKDKVGKSSEQEASI